MEVFKPVIVVAAFNRPRSLIRILKSLGNAIFDDNVTLIVSIDNDEPNNLDVKNIADDFHWRYGPKHVKYQDRHLGLREHIIRCGDLCYDYGSVVILEDDLYVSPYFYDYAIHALRYYHDDDHIRGISLYNQPIQENVRYPFSSIYDNSDVYFIQFPSSLGQVWSEVQWREFREWYDSQPDLDNINLPGFIMQWRSENSWKKYFSAFLVDKNKFFVFPRFSFTTNFNDPGTHLISKFNHGGQTPLKLFGQPYNFKNLADSCSIYDVDLELLPECISKLSPHLDDYSYELDLYGTKEPERIKKPYLITPKPSAKPIRGFLRALKPHEMNIILNMEGNDFFLTKVEDIKPIDNIYERNLNDYNYFFTGEYQGLKTQIYHYFTKVKSKIIKSK